MPKLNGDITCAEYRAMTGPACYCRLGNKLVIMWDDGGFKVIFDDFGNLPIIQFLFFAAASRIPTSL